MLRKLAGVKMYNQLKHFVLILVLSGVTRSYAQETIPAIAEEYIARYHAIAVREMQRSGVPASIKLAQGLFESGFGRSRLAQEGNNHFGIKCHKEWSGPTIIEDDDTLGECFRLYKNSEESYIDHTNFLMTRERYKGLFNYSTKDYRSWAYGLKLAGYATNPNYPQELITRIEKYQLYLFDDPSYVYVPRTPQPTETVSKEVISHPETPLPVTIQNTKQVDVTVTIPEQPKQNQKVKKIQTTFNNGLQATKALKNDTPREIAKRADVDLATLCKYNECEPNWLLPEGTYIYFSPKVTKNKMATSCQVKPGENLWLISQRYAVKVATLRKRNKLGKHEEPAEKQMVYINKTTPNKPQVSQKPVQMATYYPNKPVAPVVQPQPTTLYDRPVASLDPAPAVQEMEEQKVYRVIELPKETSPEQKEITNSTAQVTEVKQAPVSWPSSYKTHYVEPKQTLYTIAKMYGTTIEQIVEWNGLQDYNIKIGSTIIVGK